MYTHTYTHIQTHTHTQIHDHTCFCFDVHTHIHTCKHAHTHTYTQSHNKNTHRDEHYGFQLYQSDPSGNYGGWKAAAIGAGHAAANTLLKSEHKEEMSVQEVRVL
jgi:hypothetical protein